MIFRCRFAAPKLSEWREVDAYDAAAAAQDFHDLYERGFDQLDWYSIKYCPDPEKPGAQIHFAAVEIDSFGTVVSRIYHSGIIRRGRLAPRPTIKDVAEVLGWTHAPADLLKAGWEGEE